MLREAGAAEVHFRVSSPPYRWPCYYGMDTGRRSELLAADLSVGEIRDYLDVDSLAYLELDRLTHATGAPADAFCTACLSGDYPVPVPELASTRSSCSRPTSTSPGRRRDDRRCRGSGRGRPARRVSRRRRESRGDDAAHLRGARASTSRPARRPSS